MNAADLTYWLTIATVAVVAVLVFKYGATTKLGAAVPGYTQLAAFI